MATASARLFAPIFSKVGCYDADRVDNKPDPTNRWMKLAVYHNDVATISSDGVLSARRPGESVVVALAENGDKELFPATVCTRNPV